MKLILLLVLAAFFAATPARAEPREGGVSCSANIFGGPDCTEADGRSRSWSRPNIFGGFDTTYSNGERTTSRRNIFGGEDFRGPGSRLVRCWPNIFGGEDCH